MGDPLCLFFGCWNTAGHYLVGPGGGRSGLDNDRAYALSRALDGQLAPMLDREGSVTFEAAPGLDERERSLRILRLREAPQGQFLRHELLGFSLIQWWDRCQGDTRGACNSTILLEGKHSTEELLTALALHFPHVLANLSRHGVELVEVTVTP